MLLTDREKSRRNGRPVARTDESRYVKVKRSMAAIKHVLNERRRIRYLIEEGHDDSTDDSAMDNTSSDEKPKLRGEVKPGFRHIKTSPFAHLPNYGQGKNRKYRKRHSR